ncbi:MAG: bifunctional riboflavin kinase/FAD synthetase [Acidobacteria bacterium]|nr:MAG: bifunctional riboflavin kinase/FAD synthetase [Acidobacteriota bacterium]
MITVNDLTQIRTSLRYPVLSIGAFDGIHRGHQEIIRFLVNLARQKQGTAIVLSFSPHPQRIITPATAPPLLQLPEQKEKILREMGVDVLVRFPFSREISLLPPERFVTEILFRWDLREIVVGSNFRFGHKRSGDCGTLTLISKQRGIPVHAIEPVEFRGVRISSTRVRGLLSAGRVELARRLLARPYQFRGTVVRGAGNGAVLGFPTANLEPQNELTPAVGVYAGRAHLAGIEQPCVINIGFRPTLYERPEGAPVVEAHLLDFNGDLYGTTISIDFCARLRAERRFESLDSLKKQIAKDINLARKYLSRGVQERREVSDGTNR